MHLVLVCVSIAILTNAQMSLFGAPGCTLVRLGKSAPGSTQKVLLCTREHQKGTFVQGSDRDDFVRVSICAYVCLCVWA